MLVSINLEDIVTKVRTDAMVVLLNIRKKRQKIPINEYRRQPRPIPKFLLTNPTSHFSLNGNHFTKSDLTKVEYL
jgi:hypothetical protein